MTTLSRPDGMAPEPHLFHSLNVRQDDCPACMSRFLPDSGDPLLIQFRQRGAQVTDLDRLDDAHEVHLTVDVHIKDIQRTALLVHELQELIGQMRVAASPFTEPLEHAFDRFVYGGDDDGEMK